HGLVIERQQRRDHRVFREVSEAAVGLIEPRDERCRARGLGRQGWRDARLYRGCFLASCQHEYEGPAMHSSATKLSQLAGKSPEDKRDKRCSTSWARRRRCSAEPTRFRIVELRAQPLRQVHEWLEALPAHLGGALF